MIAIPERSVRDQSLNFNMIEADNLPELICISGYPVIQKNNILWSHIPYYSLRARTEEDDSANEDDSDEWQSGRSIGTVFSRKLKKWMSDTYNTWDSIMK